MDGIGEFGLPSRFVSEAWGNYKGKFPENPSVNGRIFEYIICESLVLYGIQPFYYQAKFHHVPNCAFDIVLYNERHPVVLSAKTSLRERYKQSDLEGMALKQVFRRARSCLITMNGQEADSVKQKISRADISGLDEVIIADSEDYDSFMTNLKEKHFYKAEEIQPIKGRIFPEESI